MNKTLSIFLLSIMSSIFCFSESLSAACLADQTLWKNDIPPRFQWNANQGYCGEVSLISAGLYYGQYVSQYDARAIAIKGASQDKGQLLLGKNDYYAATKMHLQAIEWDTASECNSDEFLAWIKQHVVKGYPVIIGVYTNEYLFYKKENPLAGDAEYDHIVPVFGIQTSHALDDPDYYGDDVIYFSDNGLWGDPANPPYIFDYPCDTFQKTRKEANTHDGSIYSTSNDASNYGLAITGIVDKNGDTVPVRLSTSVNYEKPAIHKGSNTRPAPMPLVLTVTISQLEPGVSYNLYRYNNFDSVPDSKFNAKAKSAYKSWQIKSSSSTYVITEEIYSDEIALYRAVKATAP